MAALALAIAMTAIEKAVPIKPGWRAGFPNGSSPRASAVAVPAREGNPKNKRTGAAWPRTGGRHRPEPQGLGRGPLELPGRLGPGRQERGHGEQAILAYAKELFWNALSQGGWARGTANAFARNRQGDALLAWENGACLPLAERAGEIRNMVKAA